MATKKRLIAVADDLILRAREGLGTPNTTNQQVLELAVDRYLGLVVSRLQSAGLVEQPGVHARHRRPRAIGDEQWERLRLAEERDVAADMIAMLRSCLVLAARGEAPLPPGG